MVTAFMGVSFSHVPVSERRVFATPGRAATRQQLSIYPVQRAGLHRLVHLVGIRHYILGVACIRS